MTTKTRSMRGRKGGKAHPKARRPRTTVLDRLEPAEARTVLERLLRAHPDLVAEAEGLAQAFLGEVDFEAVAAEVRDALHGVRAEDAYARAGPRRGVGYVHPNEAADEALNEALDPFLEEMWRLLGLGFEESALETCKGIVRGLHAFQEEGSELLDASPDYPGDAAWGVLRDWCFGRYTAGKKPRRLRAFPADWAAAAIPDWADLVARAASGR